MAKTSEIIIAGSLLTGFALLLYRKRLRQYVRGDIMNESYFSINELTHSDTATIYNIDNTPTNEAVLNMQALITNVLNPIRKKYRSYVKVNSGYRSEALNKKLGGATSSQHRLGEAADITGGSVANNRAIFKIAIELGNFDQLIWENGGQWIHISYKRNGGNRHEILNYKNQAYTNIKNNWEEIIYA